MRRHLTILDDGIKPPPGWRKASGHLVFDVKMEFTRKADVVVSGVRWPSFTHLAFLVNSIFTSNTRWPLAFLHPRGGLIPSSIIVNTLPTLVISLLIALIQYLLPFLSIDLSRWCNWSGNLYPVLIRGFSYSQRNSWHYNITLTYHVGNPPCEGWFLLNPTSCDILCYINWVWLLQDFEMNPFLGPVISLYKERRLGGRSL